MIHYPHMPAVMCVSTNQYRDLCVKGFVMSGTFYYITDTKSLCNGLIPVTSLVVETNDFASWNRITGTFAINKKTGEIRLAASPSAKDDIVILPPADGDMEANSLELYKHLVNLSTFEDFLRSREYEPEYFARVGAPPCTDIAIIRSADGKSATIQWTDPIDIPENYCLWRDTVLVRNLDDPPENAEKYNCVFSSIPREGADRTYERNQYSVESGHHITDQYLNPYKLYIYRFFTYDQNGVISYEPNNVILLPINYLQQEEMREARLKQGGVTP